LAHRPVFTYRGYALMSEGRRHKVLAGDLVGLPATASAHQEIIGALHVALRTRGESAGASRVMFSPIDVCLSDTDVLQPDLLFVGAERLAIIEAPWPLSGRPLSAVRRPARAISVPGLSVIGVGCPEYWIVDPDARAVEVLAHGQDGLQLARAEIRFRCRDSGCPRPHASRG
jgi:hypothetical protein